MEKFLAKAKPDEINRYLADGWKVKMFRTADDRVAGVSDIVIYIVLEKEDNKQSDRRY